MINNNIFCNYPDAMTLAQFAECLSISKKLASRLVHEKKVFAKKVGREYRISKSSVVEFVRGKKKRGKLYLVVSYKDSVTQKRKTKWMALGLPVGAPKSAVSKAEREAKNKFESEYRRFLEGYDDPKKYPLLPFLNDWLDNVHIRRIQESTYNGYKGRINGKMKKYFGEKITLADCKPRMIYGFYEYLREDGDGEQTVLHYHNLLHTAFEYAIRREILEYNTMDRIERPQVKKFVGDFYSVDEVGYSRATILRYVRKKYIYAVAIMSKYTS